MKRSLLAWTALSSALCLLAPAQAADYPHPTRKDTRSLEVNYDPGNIIPIWSAPGSVLLIRFAEDEAIFKVKTADSEHLGGGFVANLLTWKFKGCFVPQPAFVFTHKHAPLFKPGAGSGSEQGARPSGSMPSKSRPSPRSVTRTSPRHRQPRSRAMMV